VKEALQRFFLAGQLTIFETIFGVLFVYLLNQHLPPLIESLGISILLISVLWSHLPSSVDFCKWL
jgi:hypothetical protein